MSLPTRVARDAETDLVLLKERHIDGARDNGGQLCRRPDRRLSGRDGTDARVGAKRAGRKRGVHRVQRLAAENGELKLGETLAASNVHSKLVFLRFEHRVFDQPVVARRERDRVLQCENWPFRVR